MVLTSCGARCSAAFEYRYRLPGTGFYDMLLEEGNRHEGYVFYCANLVRITAQILKKRPIKDIIFGLESEQSNCNIVELLVVYKVQL